MKSLSLIIAIIALISSVGSTNAQSIVVPTGLENMEGDTRVGAGSPPQFRFQWVYPAVDFPQPIEIHEIRYRSDRSSFSRQTNFPSLQVTLATTTESFLSGTFEQQLEEATNVSGVFAGDLMTSTIAGDPADAPKRQPTESVPNTFD